MGIRDESMDAEPIVCLVDLIETPDFKKKKKERN